MSLLAMPRRRLRSQQKRSTQLQDEQRAAKLAAKQALVDAEKLERSELNRSSQDYRGKLLRNLEEAQREYDMALAAEVPPTYCGLFYGAGF